MLVKRAKIEGKEVGLEGVYIRSGGNGVFSLGLFSEFLIKGSKS
jgi:hypothetical protein